MVKYVELNNDGLIRIKKKEKPELQPGEILLKTHYSEVCGTDVHLKHRRLEGVPYPIIPGHVSVGEITEIGSIVTDIDNQQLNVGEFVTFLDVHETCNNCWYCLVAKSTTRCPNRRVYGITYSANEGLLGGWSEYILLKSGVKVIKLPSTITPKRFIAAGCGLPTAIHAVERAKIQLGDTVVIQGAGPVGLMAAILVKISGSFRVIMVGAPQHRLDLAKRFGIEYTINIEEFNRKKRVDQVIALTNGRGADVTIEATGNPQAVVEGMRMTRDQGIFVVVGQYSDAGDVLINPHREINKKHITIKGSWGSDFSHFYKAIQFIATKHDKYPWEEIISKVYTLEQTSQALEDVENLDVMKAIISPNKNIN